MNSFICQKYLNEEHPLQVCQSGAGFYIGVISRTFGPLSRDSQEYFPTKEKAEEALKNGTWTQRQHP